MDFANQRRWVNMLTQRTQERGASAVLLAASLILLMGMAAIAIDLGAGFNERRQAQAAADFAALAGLQFAVSCGSGTCSVAVAVDAGATEAIAVADANLPGQTLDWAGCADPSRPAAYSRVSSLSPCVSFTSNLDQARVVIPTASVDAQFGRVIGTGTLDVSALAEARQTVQQTSDIVPFAYGGGTHTCLFSNQAPQTVPPCDGPNNGNFGYLDIFMYGNDQLATSEDCSNDALGRLPSNIALGTDHLLDDWDTGDPIVNDRDACPNRSERPNELEVQTGTPVLQLTEGLIRNANGRLRCPGGGAACATVRTVSLNDTPLWDYLVAGYCTTVGSRDEMITCLDNWTPADGPIFLDTLADEPRFVAVPEFVDPATGAFEYPSSGFGSYVIGRFVPVYLETIYGVCNASTCATVFSPGDASAGGCPGTLTTVASCGFSPGNWNGGSRVEGLTALTIELDMLPESIREFFPGTGSRADYSLLR